MLMTYPQNPAENIQRSTSSCSRSISTASTIVTTDYQNDFRDELIEKGLRIVLVTYSMEGTNPPELAVEKGEYLEVNSLCANMFAIIMCQTLCKIF